MEPVTGYIKVNHQWKACGSFTRNFRRTKSADGFSRDPRTPAEEPTYDDSSDSTTPTQTTNSSSTARDLSQQAPATHSAALQVALEREVEQQQREDENADEMSKQSSLPTGRGFAPAPIPQYITSEQQQSGDSTGSNDSVTARAKVLSRRLRLVNRSETSRAPGVLLICLVMQLTRTFAVVYLDLLDL